MARGARASPASMFARSTNRGPAGRTSGGPRKARRSFRRAKGGALVLLDERGPPATSEEWAADIGRARDASRPAYAVAIGGPGRARPSLARRGPSHCEFRLDDLAAPARPRDGRRTALSGDDNSRRPPLSSPMSAAIWLDFVILAAHVTILSRIGRTAAGGAALVASFGAAWGAPPTPPRRVRPRGRPAARVEGNRAARRRGHAARVGRSAARIEAEIESIRADRARLSAALIETTAKVQDAERGAAAADDKLASLNATADELRARSSGGGR